MYSLTFCVRVMLPERHQWKPAVQAAAVMLTTPPPVGGQSPASQPCPLPHNFENATHHPPVTGEQRAQTPCTTPSYIRVHAVVWACGRGQTDTHTRMTTIHFASSTTHAKCNQCFSRSACSYYLRRSSQGFNVLSCIVCLTVTKTQTVSSEFSLNMEKRRGPQNS